ncbi:MAG TPA: class II fructose-bisphosphate aldolase [Terracidiphilus sp.]|nr:class II fructose-bisphosphate aldolase [Terracidiphilus sp.]
MPLVSMRQLLDEAAKGGYGVGAFNVNDMEQIQAIMGAAKETNSPVIIQASRGARQFAQDKYLFHLILAAAELNPEIPIAMHQDHGNSFETCKSAIELGYTSVMMDGSLKEDGKTPATFDENVAVTKKVVDFAHPRGVTVEGEIGVLGGVEDGHGAGGSGLEHITDPDQAVEFAERTGVDALAIAIGTSHGAYKFTKKPDGSVLKMDVLIKIHQRLPNTHLVMHGSSSVPKDLQDIVNEYGGKLKETWGVPVEEIQLGIRNGVRKINVDTDNRLAITGAIRKVLWTQPEKFDPRDYMKPAREAMQKVVAQRMTQFGQAGHAGDYKPIPISEIAKGYADGSLTTQPLVAAK